ncbi:protein obstructor-E-like [Anopheles marshallii]|uniref:protein obstructor-E-like n=1 Tax=Anopheles marshallii TaxID=1521116 RepID=UPI00237B2721|nr:protein obstructor-E-like [Anopheles marshallii]
MRVFEFLGLMAIIGCATAQTTVDPCVGVVGEDLLPHPNDCTKYFSCYGGKGYEQTCPDGKYFHPREKWCDIPGNVDCVTNNCPPDGIEYLPVPNQCDRYIICVAGEAFEVICSDGLFFDEKLGECNLKNETNCIVNPCIPPPTDPIDTLPIHPNPGNCQQYIICLDDEPIIKDCAPNLFFDPNESKCTIEDNCNPPTTPPVMYEPEMDIW